MDLINLIYSLYAKIKLPWDHELIINIKSEREFYISILVYNKGKIYRQAESFNKKEHDCMRNPEDMINIFLDHAVTALSKTVR